MHKPSLPVTASPIGVPSALRTFTVTPSTGVRLVEPSTRVWFWTLAMIENSSPVAPDTPDGANPMTIRPVETNSTVLSAIARNLNLSPNMLSISQSHFAAESKVLNSNTHRQHIAKLQQKWLREVPPKSLVRRENIGCSQCRPESPKSTDISRVTFAECLLNLGAVESRLPNQATKTWQAKQSRCEFEQLSLHRNSVEWRLRLRRAGLNQ